MGLLSCLALWQPPEPGAVQLSLHTCCSFSLEEVPLAHGILFPTVMGHHTVGHCLEMSALWSLVHQGPQIPLPVADQTEDLG